MRRRQNDGCNVRHKYYAIFYDQTRLDIYFDINDIFIDNALNVIVFRNKSIKYPFTTSQNCIVRITKEK